jgi:hypothetical protein
LLLVGHKVMMVSCGPLTVGREAFLRPACQHIGKKGSGTVRCRPN